MLRTNGKSNSFVYDTASFHAHSKQATTVIADGRIHVHVYQRRVSRWGCARAKDYHHETTFQKVSLTTEIFQHLSNRHVL